MVVCDHEHELKEICADILLYDYLKSWYSERRLGIQVTLVLHYFLSNLNKCVSEKTQCQISSKIRFPIFNCSLYSSFTVQLTSSNIL